MTRTIVAILALTPGMLLAQAKTPAQPSSTPVLQSSLLQPVSFAVIKSTDNATASATPVRISTGVTAPKLVQGVDPAATAKQYHVVATERTVVINLTIDATGKPTNLQIEKSTYPSLDEAVMQTVSQFRYQPGMLDGRPTEFPIRLEYTLQAGARY